MKNMKLTALLIMLVLIIVSENAIAAFQLNSAITTVTKTILRDDNGDIDPPCIEIGNRLCTVTITETMPDDISNETISSYPNTTGAFIITAQIATTTKSFSRTGQTVTSSEISQSQTFTTSDILEISICDDFPQLVGTMINLSGITSDSAGFFTVIINE